MVFNSYERKRNENVDELQHGNAPRIEGKGRWGREKKVKRN
jgi:hypothetical protein